MPESADRFPTTARSRSTVARVIATQRAMICFTCQGAAGPGRACPRTGTPCGDATTCAAGTLHPRGSAPARASVRPERRPRACPTPNALGMPAPRVAPSTTTVWRDHSVMPACAWATGRTARRATTVGSATPASVSMESAATRPVMGNAWPATWRVRRHLHDRGKWHSCGDDNFCCAGACQECCDHDDCSGSSRCVSAASARRARRAQPTARTAPAATLARGTCVASCPAADPICGPDNLCGTCTAHAQCGSNALCLNGTCQACDVVDGQNLATAIRAAPHGKTLYVCAGTYAGGITIHTNITLVGAGEGLDGTSIQGGGDALVINAGGGQPAGDAARAADPGCRQRHRDRQWKAPDNERLHRVRQFAVSGLGKRHLQRWRHSG